MKIRLWLCMLIAGPGCFAAESGIEILHHTAAAYRGLGSFEFSVTVQDVREGKVAERRLTESGAGPGKYRFEDDNPKGETRLGDGSVQWIFNRESNEYAKGPLDASGSPISEFQEIDQHVTEAQIAREETFMADGKPVPVYVVQVVRDRWPAGTLEGIQFAMYRIDKRTYAVYKVASYAPPAAVRIVLYSIRKWNQPLPEARFSFTPPDSARAAATVASSSASPSPLTGTEAPDFTLVDSNGRPVHLRDLRGKVVLIDFWATWCGPCRALMPQIEAMHRQLSDRGLVTLGLNVGEDQETVNHFAKEQSYTFTLLLGAEPDVSAKYFVQSYPTTFVVDRQGRIAFTGMGGEGETLRPAVESALAAH